MSSPEPRDGAPPRRDRVLVVSVGLSPQVVTETLHALWTRDGWLPDRLVLLATPRSAAVARAVLLDPERGAVVSWVRDWAVPAGAALVRSAEVAVAQSDSGDVDDERGAMALAECAWQVLSRLAADPATELHVSVAGGRKPAAALLGILMAVLGRPQDRLSHVLVRPEGAQGAGLFYPSREPRPVVTGAGSVIDGAQLQLALVDIPFPRLALSVGGAEGLRAAFERMTQDSRKVRLWLDPGTGRLTWDGAALHLPPAVAAFLAWLVEEQAGGAEGLPRVGAPRGGYLRAYRRLASPAAVRRAAARLPDPLDAEWMEEKAARANKLAEACGIRPRGARLVQAAGSRARAVYRLALDRAELSVAAVGNREASG